MRWSPETGSLDFLTLHDAYRRGALTPSAVIDAVYARIEARGPDPAWTSLVPRGEALARAAELERIGSADTHPLFGLPVGIKDSFDIAGYPTSEACRAWEHVATATSPFVTRLTDAGAIVVGKNNMDQFGMGLVGVRTDYGIPRCVFSDAHISGGSTSGGGVVVGAGLVSFALGGDAAGSGRVPAALNNLVGLKPTPGLIPLGPSRAGMQASHSVLTLTVEDAVTATRVLIGHDPDDPLSLREASTYALAIDPAPSRFRFAVPSESTRIFHGDTAAEALFDAAIRTLERIGGTAVEFDYRPLHAAAKMLYEDAFIARRYANLRPIVEAHGERFHPATREIISSALKYSAADVFIAQYELARHKKHALTIFDDVDVMVTPTSPTTFTVAELEADNIRLNAVMGTYTNFVNLMDCCAIAVPNGFRPDGLAQGISFVAPALQDRKIAGFGAAWQRRLGLPLGATRNPLPGA